MTTISSSPAVNAGDGRLHLELGVEEGVAFLTVAGDLDLATVEEFRERATGALTDFAGTLRIDLSGVRFIDSSGIGALITIRERAAAGRHALILDRPSSRVRTVLALAGLTGAFQLT